MPILPVLARQLQSLFPATARGEERWQWFMLTLQAILVPITPSRTSNLRRVIATLFGVAGLIINPLRQTKPGGEGR